MPSKTAPVPASPATSTTAADALFRAYSTEGDLVRSSTHGLSGTRSHDSVSRTRTRESQRRASLGGAFKATRTRDSAVGATGDGVIHEHEEEHGQPKKGFMSKITGMFKHK